MIRPFRQHTDAQLRSALDALDLSPPVPDQLVDLLLEMWRRGLPGLDDYAMRLYASDRGTWDYEESLYEALMIICGHREEPDEIDNWLALVACGFEERILDALMAVRLRQDPHFGRATLARADSDAGRRRDFELDTAVRCFARNAPADSAAECEHLMQLARDARLKTQTRLVVFERLAALPRTTALTDFFVQCAIDDDGAEPPITQLIDAALSSADSSPQS